MIKNIFRSILLLVLSLLLPSGLNAQSGASNSDPVGPIRKAFFNPPGSSRPWVYWFWVNRNVTRKGITADLEAMKRVGIGGVLIMDIDLSAMDRTPNGPIKFMDKQ